MNFSYTNLQAIQLEPSCSGKAYSNRLGTGPEYENTEPSCALAILNIPFIIPPLRSVDAKSGKVI